MIKTVLRLRRIALKSDYTIGKLYTPDGVWLCDTLEDTVRDINRNGVFDGAEYKVFGRTAIPYGEYRVRLDVVSPRFSRKSLYSFCGGKLPRLVGVPCFDGVLIHVGNTPEDTEGCILVGRNTAVGKLTDSTKTFKSLYPILERYARLGELWIRVC